MAAYRDLDAFRQERAAAHAQAEHAAAEAAEGGRKIAFEDGAQGSRGDLAAEGGAGGSRTSNTGQGEGSHSHQAGAAAGHGKIQLLHARSAKRLSTHAEHAGGFHHAHEEEESEEDDEPQMPRGMFACFSARPFALCFCVRRGPAPRWLAAARPPPRAPARARWISRHSRLSLTTNRAAPLVVQAPALGRPGSTTRRLRRRRGIRRRKALGA